MEESEGHWETIREHEDYEIYSDFPNQIRKKSNRKIVNETLHSQGYVQCYLNAKLYLKHRLIAIQFIPNPDQLVQVDHINHERSDNRISNLRWISPSNNCRNISSQNGIKYTFVDDISPDAIHVTEYGDHEFTDLYYHENVFYYWNGIQYRKLHITERRSGALEVHIRNTNHRCTSISYSKFKREYDLI
jgi:PhoPQ-activated pathogenicity-related protein